MNSSTSSSDQNVHGTAHQARQFLLAFALIFLLCVLLISALSVMTLHMGYARWHFAQLFSYQVSKVKQLRDVDVLFIGDSALGNAIDIEHWNRTGTDQAAQLALTGVYGYAGSLNMLRRATQTTRPKLVVLMHTLDMMSRPPSDKGLIMTAYTLADVLDAGIFTSFEYLVSTELLIHSMRSLVFGPPSVPDDLYDHDYWPQGQALTTQGKTPPQNGLNPDSVDPEKLKYLHKIVSYCRKTNLTCIYAHGPMVEGICQNSGPYITEVNRRIERTGLPVLKGSPLCIAWEDVGDSHDHVAPTKRIHYSNHYREQIVLQFMRRDD